MSARSCYVMKDLDGWPIIEQAVERVDYGMAARRLTEIRHDIEGVVRNRAVRWHAQRRVFVRGTGTAVLN